jgi:hypothetical protein
MNEEKFKKELTDEEIEEEVNKLEAFFEQIPEGKKILTAHNIIFHSVLYSSLCMCHGLEILDDAKVGWAENMSEEMEEDDHIQNEDDNIDD